MKADTQKLKIEMARTCMTIDGLSKAAEMPLVTVQRVSKGNNVKPATLGKIARALGVDVTEIMEV